MRFIGDVHGQITWFHQILDLTFKDELVFQLGDMGLGFPGVLELKEYPRERFLFIRGNHDNPEVCRQHPNYAGDWGSIGELFFLGGAWSIDRAWRVVEMKMGSPPIWWADEELSQDCLNIAVGDYIAAKPRVVATHDAPLSIARELLKDMKAGEVYPNRTSTALQEMFEAHQPELWFFGHYHTPSVKRVNGTVFECLPEMTLSGPIIHCSLYN